MIMGKKKLQNMLKIVSAVVLSFAVAADAFAADVEPDLNRNLSLAVELEHNTVPLKGQADLYKIADMKKAGNGNVSFDVLKAYRGVHRDLEQASYDQRQYAFDFANRKKRETFVATGRTDVNGVIAFDQVTFRPGMYLVIPKEIAGYRADPFLIALPQYFRGTEGYTWNYEVVAKPKNSQVKAKPELPDTGEDQPGPKKPSLPKTGRPKTGRKPRLPKTGDTVNVAVYGVTGIAALAGILICIKKKNDKKK